MRKNICFIILIFMTIIITSCTSNEENDVVESPVINVFEGIVFEEKSFIYDGEYHNIYVENAPDFAIIEYTGNNQKEIGQYTVTATISADNYETLVLTATLEIIAPTYNFENIKFQSETYIYDGEYHNIYVENAPDFAIIEYTGNNQKEIGQYTVTATISADNYETLVLTATLEIIAPTYNFENISFPNKKVVYDAKEHLLEIVGELPEGATVSYTCTSHSNLENVFKEVGEYVVKAEIKCQFYKTLILYSTLIIEERPIIATDDTREHFIFNQDLKFNELLINLKKCNFTLNIENASEQDYGNDIIEYNTYTYQTIAVSDGVFYHKIDYVEENEYLYDTIEIAKIINQKVFVITINCKDNSVQYSTLPLEAFYETFVGYYISAPFAYLKESENGGFEDSLIGMYYTEYGHFNIDENIFELSIKNYIFHPEFTNSEISKLTYFNIGNTIVNIDDSIFADMDEQEVGYHDFTFHGVEYSYYMDEWNANIDISHFDLVYVEKGAHMIFAQLYGMPVSTIYLPYRVYNTNFEGYQYNVYFDEDLLYQGEYIEYGEVKTKIGTSRYDAIDYFVEHGGVFNYYNTW